MIHRYSNFSNGIILNSSSNTPFETPDKSRTSRIDVKVSEKRHNLNLDPSANHYVCEFLFNYLEFLQRQLLRSD